MGTGGLPTIGHQQTCSLLLPIILGFSYTLKIAQDIIINIYLFSVFRACAIIDCFVRYTHNGTDKMFRPQFAGSTPPNSDFTPSYGIRKSPRPISNARLKMLPLLHLHPINVVICDGTY